MSAFEKREEAFALSPQQRSQWLAGLPAARLELEIKGPLALERLQQRLVALSACHEALRLRVRPEPGLLMPLQVIESTVMAANAFNVEVQAIGADHHQVTLQLPALSADRGTSLRLAQALGSTDAPSVDDEAMTYTQYSAWLYELQADEDAEPGRRFWASQALDELAASELLYRQVRSDCPDAPVTTRLDANPSVSMALDSFCQRHDASPEQVLMTAWGVLLQRLSTGDSPALTLNWVHDCRDDYEELADCWGLFAKPCPCAGNRRRTAILPRRWRTCRCSASKPRNGRNTAASALHSRATPRSTVFSGVGSCPNGSTPWATWHRRSPCWTHRPSPRAWSCCWWPKPPLAAIA